MKAANSKQTSTKRHHNTSKQSLIRVFPSLPLVVVSVKQTHFVFENTFLQSLLHFTLNGQTSKNRVVAGKGGLPACK
jgi:hypothetical protein